MDPITLFAAATAATIIGQGGHQQSGYRDTGCNIESRVEVRSERTGKLLYSHNPGCAGIGNVNSNDPVEISNRERALAGAVVARAIRGRGSDDMNGAPESPDVGNASASANNGHGGNGGPDNGHGNGHGRD